MGAAVTQVAQQAAAAPTTSSVPHAPENENQIRRRRMPAFDVPTSGHDHTQRMLDVPNTEVTPSVYVPLGAAAGGIAFLAITFFVGRFFWRKRKPVEIADQSYALNAEDEQLLMSLSYKSLPGCHNAPGIQETSRTQR